MKNDVEAAEMVPNSKRMAARKNLFLSAMLEDDGLRTLVTVRNMSSSGAQIETRDTLVAGTSPTLVRGNLRAPGRVAWVNGSRAGFQFESEVDLVAWVPGVVRCPQSSVDRMIVEARAAITDDRAACSLEFTQETSSEILRARISEELAFSARKLQALGSDLADEPAVVARHAAVLQELDITTQILGHLAGLLASEDPRALLQGIGMADLRRRLERVSLR